MSEPLESERAGGTNLNDGSPFALPNFGNSPFVNVGFMPGGLPEPKLWITKFPTAGIPDSFLTALTYKASQKNAMTVGSNPLSEEGLITWWVAQKVESR